MGVRSYRELNVWQRSYDLCKQVYRITRQFPSEERYGMASQIRRAAVSIPINIAEGHDRNTTRDYLRFLWMARGSIAELETQLMLSRDMELAGVSGVSAALNELDEIGRMLRGLIKSLAINHVTSDGHLDPRSSILDPSSPEPSA